MESKFGYQGWIKKKVWELIIICVSEKLFLKTENYFKAESSPNSKELLEKRKSV